jgi:hypothetical protein
MWVVNQHAHSIEVMLRMYATGLAEHRKPTSMRSNGRWTEDSLQALLFTICMPRYPL